MMSPLLELFQCQSKYSFFQQGCCLTGAWGAKASTITLGRPKFQTGSPNGHSKLMILRLTSSEQKQNSLLILHHEMTTENVWSSAKGKKILPTIKGKCAALCLEIRFCDFCCRVVEVSRLKMASNEYNSLWKNFDNKIMAFPSTFKTLGH